MSNDVFTAKIGPSSRVVIPAHIRALLHLEEGDTVEFVVDSDDSVRLMSPRARILNVWAKNTGGDPGNAGRDVRAYRDADIDAEDLAWEDLDQAEPDPRSEEEIAADLLNRLGLAG